MQCESLLKGVCLLTVLLTVASITVQIFLLRFFISVKCLSLGVLLNPSVCLHLIARRASCIFSEGNLQLGPKESWLPWFVPLPVEVVGGRLEVAVQKLLAVTCWLWWAFSESQEETFVQNDFLGKEISCLLPWGNLIANFVVLLCHLRSTT